MILLTTLELIISTLGLTVFAMIEVACIAFIVFLIKKITKKR